MRHLAIDLGTRRVGLAMSDEGGRFATPVEVLQVTAPEQAEDRVAQCVIDESIDVLVLGLPLNMDDSVGPAAKNAIAWGNRLSLRCGKPVIFLDERLSSFDAEQTLNARRRSGEKMTHKQKKQRLDAVAAAGFLQSYLDGKLPAIDPGTL